MIYIYVVYIYIPPEQSNYYDIEIFDNLENEAIYHVFYKSMYIDQFNQDKFNKKTRENFDTTVNNHGKRLIEFCKNCDYHILNGRTKSDSISW
jgi:hypothetical protein